MKIVLTGSLGHIGRPLAEKLTQGGHAVTVVSSKAARAREIEALGAAAAVGSVDDAGFLARTFQGADAVYTMVPPLDYTNQDLDMDAMVGKLGEPYARAIEESGVKRVVHLSSVGAHMSQGSGLILAHHMVETRLDRIRDVEITFMRPVGFYYNLYGYIGIIKQRGVIAANFGGDDPAEWVSPLDIAEAVAEELLRPASNRTAGSGSERSVRYVASDELTCSETARPRRGDRDARPPVGHYLERGDAGGLDRGRNTAEDCGGSRRDECSPSSGKLGRGLQSPSARSRASEAA